MEINTEKNTVTLSVEEAKKAQMYLNAIDPNKKNKLSFAATKLGDKLGSAMKKYNKKLEELTVDYAAKDEKGDFKFQPGTSNYMVSPDKALEYSTKQQQLTENTKIEIEVYKCKDNDAIKLLAMPVIYALNGILFDFDLSEFETEQDVKNPEEKQELSAAK